MKILFFLFVIASLLYPQKHIYRNQSTEINNLSDNIISDSSSPGVIIPISEFNALVDFYNNLGGANWNRNDNWLDTINHSVYDWIGLTIKNKHVTEIYFSPNFIFNISGVIPNSIKDLKYLKKISIYGEDIKGGLPEGFYELINLEHINLQNNSITENISSSIKNLKNLRELNLSFNKLTGEIPSEIGFLNNLEIINLANNNLSGSIPPEFGNIENLRQLHLTNNDLNGTLPSEFGNLSNLEECFLNHNQITSIPPEIGNLSSLKDFQIIDNKIKSNIPKEIGKLINLQVIRLSNNEITGSIPKEIGNLNNLIAFYADNNKLSGKIPSEFGNITGLLTVVLSNNNIEGPLPVELKNLVNLEDFILDNNQIGSNINLVDTQSLKSVNIELTRQIPPELSNLISLQRLKINNNLIMFNDIEPIFSWGSLNNIEEFIYYPQSYIGLNKSIKALINSSTTLIIDNYLPGASDEYQWFKNETLLPNANNATLELTNLHESDEGVYYCKITNSVATDLILISQNIILNVVEFMGSGIPKSEYETLIEIFNTTNGLSWFNKQNWMDTIYHSVNDWYGITVENGHVTRFEMPNNNLSIIPLALNNLKKIEVIDLSSGNFRCLIPEYNNLENLNKLSLEENNFIFNDLSALIKWSNYNNFKNNFNYSPQSILGTSIDTSIYKHDTITFFLSNYYKEENDNYTWFKNGIEIQGESDFNFIIENATLQDSGIYTCTITNSLFPDLTLNSAPYILKVLIPLGLNDLTKNCFNIFPNPAQESVFIEVNNNMVDLFIYNLTGNLIIEKSNIHSEWININQLSKGVYCFRILNKSSNIILNKKIVVK